MACELPTSCELCPRRCRANRAAGQRGVCGADDTLKVARAALHMWEEPPISGVSGSGTVFFSNCQLHCVYCQNREIANGNVGKVIDVERLAQIFLEQQGRGAVNINLVTSTHYLPQVKDALDIARDRGLELPIVYNTSGYETVETIHELDGYIDIYLTDFKNWSPTLSARYSNAPDYPAVARAALAAMFEQVGPCREGALDTGSAAHPLAPGEEPVRLMSRGVIVRHLMLPGGLADSRFVVSHVLRTYGNDVCLSLMSQYTPLDGVGERFPELAGTVDPDEYDDLVEYALALGAENSFMQEGGAAQESFIPAFDCEGV